MQTQIEQLTTQLTGNGLMFTAYDITMLLRRANPTTNIRHPEVRDHVHVLYQNGKFGSYTRSNTLVSGNNALVYHEQGTDEGDYDGNFFETSTPQYLSIPNLSGQTTPLVANQPFQTTTKTTSISSTKKAKRARYASDAVPKDKFGRIRVPASIMRATGFKPKDSVRVVIDPNVIIVTSGSDVYGANNGKKYVVDEYNNIRVHLKGKFPADKFKVEPNGSRIYITAV
jgi:bifunctional DNA-binding transcriptional regulator/antitoxin component of YhaV-PrlF toxin-antitoxin module